ncbi:hypothetical protein F4X90_08545 [Candidatus Poribacteria bacterium]|nr:hypothetical protein [Candidatus Poribacteria bacterium]
MKKFYIPIGALIIAICAIAFFTLRSDTPKEPIKVYKPVTPADTPVKVTTAKVTETSTGEEVTEASTGGHSHEDGTWHAEPPSTVENSQSSIASEPSFEETVEKFHREMARKMELKKARDAERDKLLLPILEKNELLTSKYQDVFAITPNKYREFSQDEREEFYQRCIEVDQIITDLKEQYASLPKWMKDKIEERRPGSLEAMTNIPPLSPVYGKLAAMGGNRNNEK